MSLKNSPNPFVTQLESRVTLAAAKPWGIQIAAGFNRDNALTMYAKAMKGLKSMIGKDPVLVHAAGTGTFYHVLIGSTRVARLTNFALVCAAREGPVS